jgi:hypothetical protein
VPKTIITRREYLTRQIEEIKSAFNRWVTGEEVGHSPDDNEAALHYINHGGAEHFAEEYIPEDLAKKLGDSKINIEKTQITT